MLTLLKKWRSCAGQTAPWLLWRLAAGGLLLAPFFVPVLLLSLARQAWWNRPGTARRFLRRHRLAFAHLDDRMLTISPCRGGVSNCGLVWRCRASGGRTVEYFVKVFLPLGSFWAAILPWMSPFPKIRMVTIAQRLAAELASRWALSERGIAVPGLILADPVAGVLVNECLRGEMVHELLERVSERGFLTPEDRLVLRECGRTLGEIHRAGFSVLDAQPANCMWVPERRRVYFLDLEYATRQDQRNWDVSFFLAFVSAQLPGALRIDAHRAFRQGYALAEARPVDADAGRYGLSEFLPLFQAILDLRHYTPEELLSFRGREAE